MKKLLFLLLFSFFFLRLDAQLTVRVFDNPFVANNKIEHNYYTDRYIKINFHLLNQTTKYNTIHPINFHVALLKGIGESWFVGFDYNALQSGWFSEYTHSSYQKGFTFNSHTYSFNRVIENQSVLSFIVEKRFFKQKKLFINVDLGFSIHSAIVYRSITGAQYSDNSDLKNYHLVQNITNDIKLKYGAHIGYLLLDGSFQLFPSIGYNSFARQNYDTSMRPDYVSISSKLSLLDFGIGLQYSFNQLQN